MRKIEDERIITEKRKINSTAFGIGFLGLWMIILFRQFVLKQSVAEYMDIFLLTMGLSIYITVNNVFKGYYLTYRNRQEKRRVNVIGALVGTITFTIVQLFVLGYDVKNLKDVTKLSLSTLVFFTVWILCQSILLKISEDKANEDIE